jgi:hypothetical protein
MPIGKIIPKFDGELAEDVNIHTPPGGVGFDEVRLVRWESRDFTKPLEKIFLVPPPERPKELENLNINEQAGVAHLDSPERPNSRSHCSAVNQRLEDLSSIFSASLAA